MDTSQIEKTVRAHKGPIYVAMLLRDDVTYIKVTKPAILAVLECVADGSLSVRLDAQCGGLYIDTPN